MGPRRPQSLLGKSNPFQLLLFPLILPLTMTKGDYLNIKACTIVHTAYHHIIGIYTSRCLLVGTHYYPAYALGTALSSCVGYCIQLGERFFGEGLLEVNDILTPMLQSQARKGISPRVIVSYANLLWFAQEVLANTIV